MEICKFFSSSCWCRCIVSFLWCFALLCLPSRSVVSRRDITQCTHIKTHTYIHCGWKNFPFNERRMKKKYKIFFPYSPHDLCRLMYMMQVSLLLLPPVLSLYSLTCLFLSQNSLPLCYFCYSYSIKMKINFLLYIHRYIF